MKLLSDFIKEFEIYKMKNVELDNPGNSEQNPEDELNFSANLSTDDNVDSCSCDDVDSFSDTGGLSQNLLDIPFGSEEFSDEDDELDMNLLDFNTDNEENINSNTNTLPLQGEYKFI